MNLEKYIGIPYVIFESDCWAIVRRFAKDELEKEYPQFMYSDLDNMQVAQATMMSIDHMGSKWKRVDDPELGDVLLFTIKGLVQHCGIYLQDGEFLHSLAGRMSCIENLNDSNWSKRLNRIYRWQDF